MPTFTLWLHYRASSRALASTLLTSLSVREAQPPHEIKTARLQRFDDSSNPSILIRKCSCVLFALLLLWFPGLFF